MYEDWQETQERAAINAIKLLNRFIPFFSDRQCTCFLTQDFENSVMKAIKPAFLHRPALIFYR
ncbi:hypothetical protein AT05_07620 [Schleiferia thermophila str. Yellowstone]|nr:hypothetical protein AT05_07620 [Schleiferia thermophila str. Yellowstone]